MRRPGFFRAAAALLAVAGLVSACSFNGAYDLPLPGGPIDKNHAFTITAEFADVLNVVPRSPVYVDDVTVGEVTDVQRVGWHARITMMIRDDIVLPDNAVAEIRQTSLLGEKYVDLAAPTTGAVGRLGNGDNIPLADTGRNPEVEEVLAALSFLLSGGGVGQLKTISTELNTALTGRTGAVRDLLGQLRDLVGTLDQQKQDIIDAMSAVNRLTGTLNRERDTFRAALDASGPALQVLNQQHHQLMVMLAKLDQLGAVGTRVIHGTKKNLLADLRHLRPILQRLNEAGDSLPRGLSLLISFPFPKEAADTVKGDYANARFAADISLAGLGLPSQGPGLPTVTLPTTLPTSLPTTLPTTLPSQLPTTGPTSLPSSSGLPTLPLPRTQAGNQSGTQTGTQSGTQARWQPAADAQAWYPSLPNPYYRLPLDFTDAGVGTAGGLLGGGFG